MKRLFQSLAAWPLPLLHAVGAVLGWLAFLASPTYRRRFLANAAQAGYAWREVRSAVAEAGKLLGEVPRLWFGYTPPVRWEGEERILAARALGRGVVCLTPHLGCFEVTAQAFGARFGHITVLYRPARKAWLRELVDTARNRPNLSAAPATLPGVRQMLKALRAGEAIGLLPDQVPPHGLGVWAPFFGSPAYTMTLAGRLAQQTGAPLLLFWGERLPRGQGYCIHVRDWVGEQPVDPAAAARQLNENMEALVRECPGQYLWGYARYKQPREAGAA
ncbi:lysophospholipid acyltransferase family protein [Caenimonas sedimenti]|uniref:Lysophospholipid acyltransferase family protein n=1 Tax=Caenimonas sedimenti TaxID=2596921 RepID=A0A562ZPF4_9BURK|nr:lysophospholipid acyltransferase family protein [Caenimonas sedimenti]TWO70472.1 lysophospholipid acyltransferase family protein [Caenimonas sedimenti]